MNQETLHLILEGALTLVVALLVPFLAWPVKELVSMVKGMKKEQEEMKATQLVHEARITRTEEDINGLHAHAWKKA